MPLTRLGIGNAKVELGVPERLRAGETLEKTLTVEGGNREQEIEELSVRLMSTYMVDGRSIDFEVTEFVHEEGFTIHSGEYREFDVTLNVPFDAPVTRGSVDAWVEVEAHVSRSVNPKNTTDVSVEPEQYVEALFEGFDNLGFNFADSVLIGTSTHTTLGAEEYLQDFEFHPFVSPYEQELDDVEVVCYPQEEQLETVFGVNREVSALHKFTGEGSDTVEVTFESSDVDEVTSQLREVLSNYTSVEVEEE